MATGSSGTNGGDKSSGATSPVPPGRQSTAKAPPTLNMYQKISIVRNPEDSLTFEDHEGNAQSISVEELGDAIATATPLVAPKPKLDIPVPKINIVDTYERDVSATYDIPISFVRYHRGRSPLTTIDYVADLEDETWLGLHARFGGRAPAGCPRLTVNLLEHMMDALEKSTGFDSIMSSDQAQGIFAKAIPALTDLFPAKVPRNNASNGNSGNNGTGSNSGEGGGLSTETSAGSSQLTLKHVSVDVYQYWVHKRSKLKRPLLRQFWPVTSCDDTNPHLVFRPREKEKYQLRRKRHPDHLLARRKLQALRQELDLLRQTLELVQRREALQQANVKCNIELFAQRLYDLVDTTGHARPAKVDLASLTRLIESSPRDTSASAGSGGGRTSKRARTGSSSLRSGSTAGSKTGGTSGDQSSGNKVVVAGNNHGEPAPLFVHPLETRETYATSYAQAHPSMPTYEDSHAQPTAMSYRHRPRVGRGGRLIIDRVPRPPVSEHHRTMVTAGRGMALSSTPRTRLLDLQPPILSSNTTTAPMEDQTAISRRIENHAVAALTAEDNAVVVPTETWLDTDDPIWGEERYSLEPS